MSQTKAPVCLSVLDKRIVEAYNCKCVITDDTHCLSSALLLGKYMEYVESSLLMRSDLACAFNHYYLTINPDTSKVETEAEELQHLNNKVVTLPNNDKLINNLRIAYNDYQFMKSFRQLLDKHYDKVLNDHIYYDVYHILSNNMERQKIQYITYK